MTDDSHQQANSGLYYHGTNIEVCLGDRVRIKRWLRGSLVGVVCYIPGLSPYVSEFEDGSIREWAIAHADRTVTSMLYVPGEVPSKSIEFVSRGDVAGWELEEGEEFH